MKSWKNIVYYLGTLLLTAMIIYASNSAYLHYIALYKHNHEQTLAQLAYLYSIGGTFIIGLLLGVEALFRQRKTTGGWRFNYAKVLLIAIPSLLGSLWFILSIHGIDGWVINIDLMVLLHDYQLVLALVAGWALGGSFYKETSPAVLLPVGGSDDQKA